MANDTIFFVNKLSLGGLEKVSVIVSNSLSNVIKTSMYSLKGDDYGYILSDKLTYIHGGKRLNHALVHPILILKTIITRKLADKKEFNFKVTKSDVDFLKYNNIVLSEADIFYTEKIKKINPKANVVGWIHSTYESYKEIYMKDSFDLFLKNLLLLDTVVVLTEADRESFSKLHKNVVKINNPLTTPAIKSIEYRKSVKYKKVCFVGRLSYKHKGLDYLIELAKYLPSDWIISVAGDGPDKEKFINDIKQCGLEDKFEIKGILKGNELIEHYLTSDIFVLTSRWEGFGLVITEAMNYGLPVVAFDNDGPREIIGTDSQYGLLIANGDAVGMSKAVQLLISDRDKYEFYSKQSLKRKKNYEIENITKDWLKILNRLEDKN